MKKQLAEILKDALIGKEVYVYVVHYSSHRPTDFIRVLEMQEINLKLNTPFEKITAKIIAVDIENTQYIGDLISFRMDANGETFETIIGTLLDNIEFV